MEEIGQGTPQTRGDSDFGNPEILNALKAFDSFTHAFKSRGPIPASSTSFKYIRRSSTSRGSTSGSIQGQGESDTEQALDATDSLRLNQPLTSVECRPSTPSTSGGRDQSLRDLLIKAHQLNVTLRQKLEAAALVDESLAQSNLQKEGKQLDEDVAKLVSSYASTSRPASAVSPNLTGLDSQGKPSSEDARFVRAHLGYLLEQREKQLRIAQKENDALRQQLRKFNEHAPLTSNIGGADSVESIRSSPHSDHTKQPLVPVHLAQEHIALRQHFTRTLTDRVAAAEVNAKLPKKVLFLINQLQSALISEASQRQTERIALNGTLLATENEACERFIGQQLIQMKLDRANAELNHRKEVERSIEAKVFDLLRKNRLLEKEVAALRSLLVSKGIEIPPLADISSRNSEINFDAYHNSKVPQTVQPNFLPQSQSLESNSRTLTTSEKIITNSITDESKPSLHSKTLAGVQSLPSPSYQNLPVNWSRHSQTANQNNRPRPHGSGLISGSLPRPSTQRRPNSGGIGPSGVPIHTEKVPLFHR